MNVIFLEDKDHENRCVISDVKNDNKNNKNDNNNKNKNNENNNDQ